MLLCVCWWLKVLIRRNVLFMFTLAVWPKVSCWSFSSDWPFPPMVSLLIHTLTHNSHFSRRYLMYMSLFKGKYCRFCRCLNYTHHRWCLSCVFLCCRVINTDFKLSLLGGCHHIRAHSTYVHLQSVSILTVPSVSGDDTDVISHYPKPFFPPEFHLFVFPLCDRHPLSD